MFNLLKAILGTRNDREIRRMGDTVARINALEEDFAALSDDALRAHSEEFRGRFAAGTTLDELLPEAFAAVREASRRTLGMRHFDCQLMGGMVLHKGQIAEMRTGEGKTLVATLPAYLNALSGDSVILVTVNDYLARRDADWMGPIYHALGLSLGVVTPNQSADEKRTAYVADILYATNNELGFDFLRDNMAFSSEDRCQRGFAFAIIDEVDSILVDEARTPLIISGPATDSSELYHRINKLIPGMTRQAREETEEQPLADDERGDYLIDEKNRQVELTERGHELVEGFLAKEELITRDDSLYAGSNLRLLHHVQAAMKAHFLYHKNVEYIIQGGQVVLIDEHTGRTMSGRRLSEGIHQALEVKESVEVQSETQTLASTTFQNFFRQFDKLAGMTGTAATEAQEFRQIYGLDVVVVPTNKSMIRKDLNDLVFMTMEEKYAAIIEEILTARDKGAPVLVGTASIETSEKISAALQEQSIPHEVLNAKQHEREAEIIAQAGRPGQVTIATNMAGRGTDIVLGGNWEAEIAHEKESLPEQVQEIKSAWQKRHHQVIEAGGLHILGTERHESRRIDNQLRGRSGRQGDPGQSRFFLSLEDNLMRIFLSERVKSMMQGLGMDEGEAIESRLLSRSIEKAQRRVEGRNFDIRKQLLEYDDVANDQRLVIYNQRRELMDSEDISEVLTDIRTDVLTDLVQTYLPPDSLEEQWNVPGLETALAGEFGLELPVARWVEEDHSLQTEALVERLISIAEEQYQAKCETLGPPMRILEKQIMLQVLDSHWKEHLAAMDHLRHSIGLRAYAQRNPKQEYKREAFEMFQAMLESIKREVVRFLLQVRVGAETPEEIERRRREELALAQLEFRHSEAVSALEMPAAPTGAVADGSAPLLHPAAIPQPAAPAKPATIVRKSPKVGRNQPCPCGSGRKFKHCHGKAA